MELYEPEARPPKRKRMDTSQERANQFERDHNYQNFEPDGWLDNSSGEEEEDNSFVEFDEEYDEGDEYGDSEAIEVEGVCGANQDNDSENDIAAKRERLDWKLKTNFERIFAKYGKDFTGIGDEIDLRTGDIVVNNGHLSRMQNEKDAGGSMTKGRSMLRALTVEPEQRRSRESQLRSGSLIPADEQIISGDDRLTSDEEQTVSRASREKMIVNNNGLDRHDVRAVTDSRRIGPLSLAKQAIPPSNRTVSSNTTSTSDLSSKTKLRNEEIISHFGSQLGPKIIEYVSQQPSQNECSIDPAWQTPNLKPASPGKRPIIKSMLLQLDDNPSPSPAKPGSIWATHLSVGRPKSSLAKALEKMPKSTGEQSISNSSLPKRILFTAEDDRQLDSYVASLGSGIRFWYTSQTWAGLTEKNPRHSWKSWAGRYRKRHPLTTLGASDTDDAHSTSISQLKRSSRNKHAVERGHRKLKYSEFVMSSLQMGSMTSAKSRLASRGSKRTTDNPVGIGSRISLIDDHESQARQTCANDEQYTEKATGLRQISGSVSSNLPSNSRPSRVRQPAKRPDTISWTEAVATLKAIDPSMHAGIVDDDYDSEDSDGSIITTSSQMSTLDDIGTQTQDNNRSRTSGTSTLNSVPLEAIANQQSHKSKKHEISQKKTSVAKYTNLLDSYPYRDYAGRTKRRVSFKFAGEEHFVEARQCPHEDCASYRDRLYIISLLPGRRDCDLKAHLRDDHGTSPFECVEEGCDKAGPKGFFRLGYLILHVKRRHPGLEPYLRLESRVSPEKLLKIYGVKPSIRHKRRLGESATKNRSYLDTPMIEAAPSQQSSQYIKEHQRVAPGTVTSPLLSKENPNRTKHQRMTSRDDAFENLFSPEPPQVQIYSSSSSDSRSPISFEGSANELPVLIGAQHDVELYEQSELYEDNEFREPSSANCLGQQSLSPSREAADLPRDSNNDINGSDYNHCPSLPHPDDRVVPNSQSSSHFIYSSSPTERSEIAVAKEVVCPEDQFQVIDLTTDTVDLTYQISRSLSRSEEAETLSVDTRHINFTEDNSRLPNQVQLLRQASTGFKRFRPEKESSARVFTVSKSTSKIDGIVSKSLRAGSDASDSSNVESRVQKYVKVATNAIYDFSDEDEPITSVSMKGSSAVRIPRSDNHGVPPRSNSRQTVESKDTDRSQHLPIHISPHGEPYNSTKNLPSNTRRNVGTFNADTGAPKSPTVTSHKVARHSHPSRTSPGSLSWDLAQDKRGKKNKSPNATKTLLSNGHRSIAPKPTDHMYDDDDLDELSMAADDFERLPSDPLTPKALVTKKRRDSRSPSYVNTPPRKAASGLNMLARLSNSGRISPGKPGPQRSVAYDHRTSVKRSRLREL